MPTILIGFDGWDLLLVLLVVGAIVARLVLAAQDRKTSDEED